MRAAAVAAALVTAVSFARPALCQPRDPAAPRHERRAFEGSIELEAGGLAYFSVPPVASGYTVGIVNHVRLQSGFDFALGGRLVVLGSRLRAGAATEGFVRAGFAPAFGPWCPRLSLELGVTTTGDASVPNSVAPGSFALVQPPQSAAYVAVVATPVRFRFGRYSFAVLGFSAGTPIPDAASALRLHVHYFEIEMSF
jgi:hypothetical protein